MTDAEWKAKVSKAYEQARQIDTQGGWNPSVSLVITACLVLIRELFEASGGREGE